MEIRLNNIKKSYENQEVLKGIDLTVGQGDYISIIGRSGCGKTTLLKIIGLLTVPTDGELLIDGKSYSDLWQDELADIRRNHKDCHQANRTSEVAVKHPGTRLSHPAVSLVNHGAKENVTDSVKKLGNRDQGPDDPCIQPDRIGQENHDKG